MSIVADADETASLMPGTAPRVAAPEDIDSLVRARECVHLWGLTIGVAFGIFFGLYTDFAEMITDSTLSKETGEESFRARPCRAVFERRMRVLQARRCFRRMRSWHTASRRS